MRKKFALSYFRQDPSLTSIDDGDFWDSTGFHEGSNVEREVTFESIAIAENFFAAFLIGLASTQEAETWKPLRAA